MGFVSACLSFAAILAFCVFLSAKCRLHSAAAPLVALGLAVLFFALAGVAGLLLPALWVFYLACFGLCVFALRGGAKRALQGLLTPGFLLFAGASLVLLVWLAQRQPVFGKWDEFSFWGTAAKLLHQDNRLYTTADIGWFWTGTQSPALPLLGWFAQGPFGAFAPWKVFWGYDMLLFACVATLLLPVQGRQWRVWVPLGVVALLFAYLFSVYYPIIYPDVTYMNSYGDLPAGMLFGGVLVLYYAARSQGQNALLWCAAPLGLFALVKDNVFPVVLVALVLMLLDTLLFERGAAWRQKLVGAGAALAAALGAYGVWALHRGWANAQNPVTGGESTGVSMVDSALAALRQLLGAEPKTQRFALTLDKFGEAFFDGANYPVSTFGSLFVTVLVIVAVSALGIVLARGKTARLRAGLAAGVAALGFAGYLFVMLVSWGFLFKSGVGLPDYARYLSSYLAGWLLLALALVVLPLAQMEREKNFTLATALRLALFGAAGALCAVFALWAPSSLTVLGYPDAIFAAQYQNAAYAERLAGDLPAGTRVLFIDQEGDGELWFEYSYNLLPAVLDYSITGGAAIESADDWEAAPEVYGSVAEMLAAYMEEARIDYVLVVSVDDEMQAALAALGIEVDLNEEAPVLYSRAGAQWLATAAQ